MKLHIRSGGASCLDQRLSRDRRPVLQGAFLYATPHEKAFGCARVVCNDALAKSRALHGHRKLSRSVWDAGWRQLGTLLAAKAEQYGGQVVVINRWLPTSRICSACGHHDGRKELSIPLIAEAVTWAA